MEADRQVASVFISLIIDGALVSTEVTAGTEESALDDAGRNAGTAA